MTLQNERAEDADISTAIRSAAEEEGPRRNLLAHVNQRRIDVGDDVTSDNAPLAKYLQCQFPR